MWKVFLNIIFFTSECSSLIQFEAYWESLDSFLYNDDELHNPWYIDLGEFL